MAGWGLTGVGLPPYPQNNLRPAMAGQIVSQGVVLDGFAIYSTPHLGETLKTESRLWPASGLGFQSRIGC